MGIIVPAVGDLVSLDIINMYKYNNKEVYIFAVLPVVSTHFLIEMQVGLQAVLHVQLVWIARYFDVRAFFNVDNVCAHAYSNIEIHGIYAYKIVLEVFMCLLR